MIRVQISTLALIISIHYCWQPAVKVIKERSDLLFKIMDEVFIKETKSVTEDFWNKQGKVVRINEMSHTYKVMVGPIMLLLKEEDLIPISEVVYVDA